MGAQITSAGGYIVGLNDYGSILDDLDIGYIRPDVWDPFGDGDFFTGSPRDVWGISSGAYAGWYDPDIALDGPPTNLTANGSPTYGASTASMSWFLKPAASNMLQVDYVLSFSADNVLKSVVTITNVSGVTQSPVKYRRVVEFKITDTGSAPDNIVTVDTNPVGAITAASPYCFGPGGGVFQPISPLVALNATTTGGTTGTPSAPQDLGAAFDILIGSMASAASVSFNIFHAISTIGQTEAQLRAQMTAFGATFIVSSQNGNSPGVSPPLAVAVGYGAGSVPPPVSGAAIEPSWIMRKKRAMWKEQAKRRDAWWRHA